MFRHILAKGETHGLIHASLESMGIRRIEAAIMDNGTDMDAAMTPFDAGLGHFVTLDKETDFIGKAALVQADKGCRFFGVTCPTAAPLADTRIGWQGEAVGRTTSGAWSPYLDCGIAFVCFEKADDWIGRQVTVTLADGSEHEGKIVALPFYDSEKKIPRGLTVANV
ncbi:MAG: aminomethyl transferase family protein [Rhodospirillales bacterium]|nr:aminomethyl transferase family protein [Rhodospirillales bacterium]